jgi:flagellar biosynthesis/type III secretory pathway protein FliH
VQYELTIPFRRSLRAVAISDKKSEHVPAVPIHIPQQPVIENRHLEEQKQQEEQAAIRTVLGGLQKSLKQLQSDYRVRMDELQRCTIDLAVTLASRLIHAKIEAGEFGLESMVREAVKGITSRQAVDIRLHPEDVKLLEARFPAQESILPEQSACRLIADPALRRGETRLDAGDVCVESRWRAQLEEIHQHLLRSVGHANTES